MASDSKWRLPGNDEAFEDLCCLVAQEKFNDTEAQKYGRRGQKQFGIDIQTTDYRKQPAQQVVIQCKFKQDPDSFSLAKAKKELKKELNEALASHLSFERFIYASNIKRDTRLQDFATSLGKAQGIKVAIWSIDDIKLDIESSNKLAAIYTVTAAPAEVNVYLYDGQEIDKKLNTPPVNPTVFIGREDELTQIHRALNQGHLLLLVNGEGGIGKTTLASAYYHRYINQYRHLAWLYADSGIVDALLTLERALHITPEPTQSQADRLNKLIVKLSNLKQPCLLVIDNANTLADLETNYPDLCRLSNFHLLITSRIGEFAEAQNHAVGKLGPEAAKALFCRHYSIYDGAQDDLLLGVFIAIGFNTLVIELLAKSLAKSNRYGERYPLSQLLADIDEKGLTQLRHTKPVKTMYGNGNQTLQTEKPENIIAAMYQMAQLNQAEQRLIAIFSVLPAEPIEHQHIQALLEGVDPEILDDLLASLQQQGWIEFNDKETTFKCSPVVQQVVRSQNTDVTHLNILVYRLAVLLEYEPGTGHLLNCSYADAAIYARFAEQVLKSDCPPNQSLSILYERAGRYYQTVGDLSKALSIFEAKMQLDQAQLGKEPDNSTLKNSLAIAYEKLGDIYTAQGDLDKAQIFYQDETKLFEQLHHDHPEQVGFKNGLANAYEKLGDIYRAQGDLDKAQIFYQDETKLRIPANGISDSGALGSP